VINLAQLREEQFSIFEESEQTKPFGRDVLKETCTETKHHRPRKRGATAAMYNY